MPGIVERNDVISDYTELDRLIKTLHEDIQLIHRGVEEVDISRERSERKEKKKRYGDGDRGDGDMAREWHRQV